MKSSKPYQTRLVFFMLIAQQLITISCTDSVKWTVATSPIIFGGEVTLICSVPVGACKPYHMRQWSGGLEYKVLAMNGLTYNPTKYEMLTNQRTLDFNLTLKNFSLSDDSHAYTCICGRSQYTDFLMVNNSKYILMPDDNKKHDNSMVFNWTLNINITIEEIHPIPNCTLHLQRKTHYLAYTSLHVNRLFYQVCLVGSFPLLKNDCSIFYRVSCRFATKNIYINRLVSCDSHTNLRAANGFEILAAIISIAIFLIVCIVIYQLCKTRNQKCRHGSKESPTKVLSTESHRISLELIHKPQEMGSGSELNDNDELEKTDDELDLSNNPIISDAN